MTKEPDLACRRVVELVTDYLEGALATSDAEQLEQHLLICDACQAHLDQHRTVIKVLSQLAPVERAPAQDARAAALALFRRMRDEGGGGEP